MFPSQHDYQIYTKVVDTDIHYHTCICIYSIMIPVQLNCSFYKCIQAFKWRKLCIQPLKTLIEGSTRRMNCWFSFISTDYSKFTTECSTYKPLHYTLQNHLSLQVSITKVALAVHKCIHLMPYKYTSHIRTSKLNTLLLVELSTRVQQH